MIYKNIKNYLQMYQLTTLSPQDYNMRGQRGCYVISLCDKSDKKWFVRSRPKSVQITSSHKANSTIDILLFVGFSFCDNLPKYYGMGHGIETCDHKMKLPLER